MDELIEELVRSHFPDDETMLVPIVIMEIQKHLEKNLQSESLSLKCIRSVLQSQIKPNSTEQVYYKLIFQEPLDIFETSQQPKEDEYSSSSSSLPQLFWMVSRFFLRLGGRVSHLKNDPVVMKMVLEQNLCSHENRTVYVYIMEKMCRVEVNRQLVVEVPNEEGVEYDKHWPLVFGRLAFLKNIYYIEFLYEVKTGFNWDQLKTWMETFIAEFRLLSPADKGWKVAAERTDRAVYLVSNVVLKNQEFFTQVFIAEPEWLEQNPEFRRIYDN